MTFFTATNDSIGFASRMTDHYDGAYAANCRQTRVCLPTAEQQPRHSRRKSTPIIATVLLSASFVLLSGCSVNRAFSQEPPKDLSFIKEGAVRDTVRGELGSFMLSSDSANCDVHAFSEGSGGFKYVRGITYSLLGVASLGLTEIITNPIEASIGNDKVTVRACYNESNKLVRAERLRADGETPM